MWIQSKRRKKVKVKLIVSVVSENYCKITLHVLLDIQEMSKTINGPNFSFFFFFRNRGINEVRYLRFRLTSQFLNCDVRSGCSIVWLSKWNPLVSSVRAVKTRIKWIYIISADVVRAIVTVNKLTNSQRRHCRVFLSISSLFTHRSLMDALLETFNK